VTLATTLLASAFFKDIVFSQSTGAYSALAQGNPLEFPDETQPAKTKEMGLLIQPFSLIHLCDRPMGER